MTHHVQLLPEKKLLMGDQDGELQTWSLQSIATRIGRSMKWQIHKHAITSMQGEGELAVTGSPDGKVKVWELESGKLLRDLVVSDQVWKVACSGGDIFAVFTDENQNLVLGVSSVFDLNN
jgi:WD40 repeat protein